MNKCRNLLRAPSGSRVAFQGELGAFSEQARLQIFGRSVLPLPCQTFEEVFSSVSKKKTDFAVIPIENSLAGSIHQNFDLLTTHPVDVIAETFVRIEHHLIGYPGVELSDVEQVYSHPVALAQCQKFLRRLKKIEVVSFYDTAGSVKYIRERNLDRAAAIASAHAAKIYGLKILRRNIEDNRENFTRFLALARHNQFRPGGEKTTIVFGLRNEPGALFKALSVFALRNIDLTKIESRPIHGQPWEYLFYIDIQSDLRTKECSNALRHLQEMTLYFKVLGSYSTS
jgi:prephenate dehydratase